MNIGERQGKVFIVEPLKVPIPEKIEIPDEKPAEPSRIEIRIRFVSKGDCVPILAIENSNE